MKHRYRKSFDHAYEAQTTAEGFHKMPGIDGRDVVDVSVAHEGGKHWVYVLLEGDVDPEGVFDATGYERVD